MALEYYKNGMWVPLASEDQALPTGGTTGQTLVKASSTNYDTAWTKLGPAAYNVSGGTDGGRWGVPGNVLQNASNRSPAAADRLHYWPIFVDYPISVTGWIVRTATNTNAANVTFRAGIYSTDSANEPSTLLQEFGTATIVANTVATYVNVLSPSVTLGIGTYYLAWTVSSSASITYRTPTALNQVCFLNTVGTSHFSARYDTATNSAPASSSLPATAPAISGIGLDSGPWGPMFSIDWDAL